MQQQINALPANSLDLKDIHLPEQVANYPTAYGWWLLAVMIIFIIVIAIIKIKKSVKRNQVKKQALAQLSLLLENNSPITNSDIIALLKWSAMHYFSRVELAKVYGESLKMFFISKLPIKHQQKFTELSAQAFINQYQANIDADYTTRDPVDNNEKFHQAAALWLNHALPPKPLKKGQEAPHGALSNHEAPNQGASV